MISYLYCSQKKNNPRVHHSVCETSCKKYKTCSQYLTWYEVANGKPMDNIVVKKTIHRTRKKYKKRSPKAKAVKV